MRALFISGTAAVTLGVGIGCGVGASSPPTRPSTTATETARAPFRLVGVAKGLGDALFATSAPGQPGLYVVQQSGRVLHLVNGRVTGTFLDVHDRITTGGERGLLGLAFHPDYAQNGRLFVDYTDSQGNTRVVQFTASGDRQRVDTSTAKQILEVDQPYENHNGGMLAFGPDGMLYIGLGDGGSGGDPQHRAQDLGTLLGKILRIDVDHGDPYAIPADNPFRSTSGARPEIWFYGLRNPWRFSFDRATGDMWIGDVGQNAIEEVDRAPAGQGGLNFGWSAWEGRSRFGNPQRPGSTVTMPVFQYLHRNGGVSVTGGYVYRGAKVPALKGRYLVADWANGHVWSIRAGAKPGDVRDITRRLGVRLHGVTSFAEGAGGEVYVIANQALYRFSR
ncbi:MAG: PQQ-dependent sugar dehydrogenase [Thermoleophilia bacterium]